MCGCLVNNNEDQIHKELIIKGRGKYISFDALSVITKQKEKNVYKIIKDENSSGTGFLCLIPYPDRLNQLPVLITCNHILGKDDIIPGKKIQLIFNDKLLKSLELDESRIIYTSEENEFDTTIIEIKADDGFDINNMLEIDYDIYKEEESLIQIFKNQTVYIIHYPLGKKLSYSNDIIKNIDITNTKIEHLCSTEEGSSGAPILNINNFKVIGIHLGKNINKKVNIGIIIKKPIDEFNKMVDNKMHKIMNYNINENKEKIILKHPIETNKENQKINENNKKIENKSIDGINYFSWSFPDDTATGTPFGSVKILNGVITFPYNISKGIYAGCQTETLPGLGTGIDFRNYKMIKVSLTNKGISDVHCNIIIKTGNAWVWFESPGTNTLGGIENQEQIINGGKTVKIYYYLHHNFWKSKNANWQYADKISDLDDVRAIEFKVYNAGEEAQGIFEISKIEILENDENI